MAAALERELDAGSAGQWELAGLHWLRGGDALAAERALRAALASEPSASQNARVNHGRSEPTHESEPETLSEPNSASEPARPSEPEPESEPHYPSEPYHESEPYIQSVR